jgi:hypothetical protein
MRVLCVCLLFVVVGCKGNNNPSPTSAVSQSCRSVTTESDYVAVKGGDWVRVTGRVSRDELTGTAAVMRVLDNSRVTLIATCDREPPQGRGSKVTVKGRVRGKTYHADMRAADLELDQCTYE